MTEIDERRGIAGSDAERLAVMRDRLLATVERGQGEAEIAVRLGPARLQLERAPIALDRLAMAPQLLERIADVDMGAGEPGILVERFAGSADGLFGAVLGEQDGAQIEQRIRVPAAGAKDGFIGGRGFVDLAAPLEAERLIHERVNVRRIDPPAH